ncbi:glutathione s-transferase f13 [Quercus suber]|uniref:glutathione transferase n=1 Tax=Quercus suber TaxID=58331 RepID=A0AAW0L3F0_QUESU
MAIKVHGALFSTCTARVLICLCEKGLDYELLAIDMPFGEIPAFKDGEVSLFESRVINRYLARKHKDIGTDLLLSNSLTQSALVETWMEVEAHKFDSPSSYGKAPDKQVIETEMEKLGKVLDVYEERLSKSKYLAGENYSLADLHHIPHLVYFKKTSKANAITSRPHVSAWWNDISSRPATVKISETMSLL